MSPTAPYAAALAQLPRFDWCTDYGLRRALNEACGQHLGDYYQGAKSHLPLMELIRYQDARPKRTTLAYYGLPADTEAFLSWVFNWVAYCEPLGPEQDQQLLFPYPQLYLIWQLQRWPYQRVNVYADRIVAGDVAWPLTGTAA